MKPKFILESTQRQPLNALEQHLLTVASAWCQGTLSNSINSLNDLQKKLECELAWFCFRHDYRAEPPVINCGQQTMLIIKSAGLNGQVVATIGLDQADDDDLAYAVQQASSAGYYTPRFLSY